MRRHELTVGDERLTAIYAPPTSGWGHVADEQPLPFVTGARGELTPRYGGEDGWPGTGVDSLPLPAGRLTDGWPLAQRLFNLPRRRVNIYWRNLFASRCRADGWLYLAEQLRYEPRPDGFRGWSPLVALERVFRFERERFEVCDRIRFRRALAFTELRPAVLALFPETAVWPTGGEPPSAAVSVETIGFGLEPIGPQTSAAGRAVLWAERLRPARFARGEVLERRYRFHFARRVRRATEQRSES